MIIDGKNAILGRLCSNVAKTLLEGRKVYIINAEEIIITGNPRDIEREYLIRRRRGDPFKGPFYPKRPDLIVKRTVKTMLPGTARGRNAYKRLRVYVGAKEKMAKRAKPFDNKKDIKTKFIKIGDLSRKIGWTG